MCEGCKIKEALKGCESESETLQALANMYSSLDLPCPERMVPLLKMAADLRKRLPLAADKNYPITAIELDLVQVYGAIRALLVYLMQFAHLPQTQSDRAVVVRLILEDMMIDSGVCAPTVKELVLKDSVMKEVEGWMNGNHPSASQPVTNPQDLN